ncbi:MAG: motility associated factor glycosyltransferase family protein [Clostridium lundense]|nr:motility associated factor glycosyltransferase family protein [Clostridium lundense]
MNPITQFAFKEIELGDLDNDGYCLEQSKDGKNVIKLIREDRSIYLGSKYSVKRDIEQFISQMGEYNINTIFIVFGIGTGEHILQLLKNISKSNKILIIEPDNNILSLIHSMECYKTIIEDKRVVVSPYDENRIAVIYQVFIEEFNINNIKLMVYANYDKVYSAELLKCYEKLKSFIQSSIININTTKYFAKQLFKCFINNIKYISKSTIINDFKDIYRGKPAIIVSAGPSLEKNIEQLTNVKDNFVVFSGGRTISALKKVDVIPDVVAVVDSGENSYRVIRTSLDCEAPLAFCEVTNFNVVKEYSGDKIFFQEGFNLGNVTADILEKQVDTLFQGGSVAHTCTSLAEYMGCNPIIFIGQDLAYTNGKTHADVASFENNIADGNEDMFVEDVYGNKVATDMLFNSYRILLESFIESCKDTTFINSTEGGANIKGTLVMDLCDGIKKYSSDIPIDKTILKSKLDTVNNDNKIVINNVEKILNYMKDINKNCKKAIDISHDLMDYYLKGKSKNVNKLLSFIGSLNTKIQKLEILNNLLQPIFYDILMNPEYAEKENEPEAERGIKLAKQTNTLYSNIVDAINEAVPLIEQCLVELKEIK